MMRLVIWCGLDAKFILASTLRDKLAEPRKKSSYRGMQRHINNQKLWSFNGNKDLRLCLHLIRDVTKLIFHVKELITGTALETERIVNIC